MKYVPLILGIGIVLGLFGLVHMHEQVHVQINLAYGINSTVEYFTHFPDAVTIGDKPCPTEECKLAHNINEAVGYHLITMYCIFALLLYVIILLIIYRNDMKLYELAVKRSVYGK